MNNQFTAKVMQISTERPNPGNSLSSLSATAQNWMPAVFRMLNTWKLSETDQAAILGVEYRTLHNWKGGKLPKKVPTNVVERASLITGIYKSLKLLIPENRLADKWVTTPNDGPLFHGHPPIERMLSGYTGDLYDIRRYLDALRGG